MESKIWLTVILYLLYLCIVSIKCLHKYSWKIYPHIFLYQERVLLVESNLFRRYSFHLSWISILSVRIFLIEALINGTYLLIDFLSKFTSAKNDSFSLFWLASCSACRIIRFKCFLLLLILYCLSLVQLPFVFTF